MIVLGLDPGLSMTGWGAVAATDRSRLALLGFGCIRTAPAQPLAERLKLIFDELNGVIAAHTPQVVAVEQLFFSKEARTVAAVAQARGVLLLAAARAGLPVAEYNPRHIKIALTGYGSADKNQMQQMVRRLLGLAEIPRPDDAADAVAAAICHISTARW